MSTTSSSTEATKASTLDDLASKGIIFPNIGKSVEELPPRMRFAPSPTGRLVTLLGFTDSFGVMNQFKINRIFSCINHNVSFPVCMWVVLELHFTTG
jgi:hypothetical protein